MDYINNFNLIALVTGALIGLTSCCGDTRVIEYYDQEKELVKKVTVLNTCSGEINGKEIWYDPGGDLVSVSYYEDGSLEGQRMSYCEENNTVADSMNYTNGMIEGLRVTRYCSTGRLKSVVEYEQGLIMNVVELFDEAGNRLFPGKHKDGNGEFLKYDRFGDLRVLLRVSDGMLNGYSILYISPNFVDSIYFESGYSEARDIGFKTYEGAY